MHSDNLGTELFRNKVLRSVICRSTMFCRCGRAIKDCDLNVSAGRTQQSNHRVTYIMKHPLLSSLSRPPYCVKQYRTNIQNRHGLKVTRHHWPSSIWTLLCCTLPRRWQCLDQEIWLRLIAEWPCCPLPKTNINIAASLSGSFFPPAACTCCF